jgi:hypothetical protein
MNDKTTLKDRLIDKQSTKNQYIIIAKDVLKEVIDSIEVICDKPCLPSIEVSRNTVKLMIMRRQEVRVDVTYNAESNPLIPFHIRFSSDEMEYPAIHKWDLEDVIVEKMDIDRIVKEVRDSEDDVVRTK